MLFHHSELEMAKTLHLHVSAGPIGGGQWLIYAKTPPTGTFAP